MRLTPKEIHSIKQAVSTLDKTAEIFIYGSRTDDTLKGGDIDILVLSDVITFSDKITLLTELKLALGEQKIDLTVKSAKERYKDPFVSSILDSALRIH